MPATSAVSVLPTAEEAAFALAAAAADASGGAAHAGGGAKAAPPPPHWALRKEFSDARDSVVDVQFAPHHLGQPRALYGRVCFFAFNPISH